jgi:hypothetical protein
MKLYQCYDCRAQFHVQNEIENPRCLHCDGVNVQHYATTLEFRDVPSELHLPRRPLMEGLDDLITRATETYLNGP